MSESARKPRRPGVSRIQRVAEMSEGMRSALEKAGVSREAVLAAFPADLGADGRFAERWLVVARDRLVAVEGDGERVSAQEPFQGITGIESRRLVGGGVVLVKRHKEQKELVRCSRLTDRAIQAALAKLRVHLELEKPGADADKDKDKEKDAASAERPPEIAKDKPPDEKKEEAPPPEALPELPADKVQVFLDQLNGVDEQRFCATCGLPLKPDSSVCPICVHRGRTLWRIFGFARGYRTQLLVLFGLLLSTVLFRVAPPYIQGRIFDVSLVPKDPLPQDYRLWYLVWAVLALLTSHLLAAGLRIVSGRIAVTVGGAVSRDVRGTVFNHLQFLSLSYFDRHKTGALMTRVSSDTRQLQGFLVDGVQYTLVGLLEVLIITATLLWLNWKLTLLVLIPAPFVILYTKLVWSRIFRRFRRLWETMSRLGATLNDSLRGVRVVKAFGGEEQEIRRFGTRSEAAYQAEMSAEKTWITLIPLINLIMGLGLYFVLMAGGAAMIRESRMFGPLTPGLIVAFITYLPMLYGPLQIMTRLNDWLTRSMTAAERIFEILDTEPEVAEPPDPVPLPAMKGRIDLKDVTFGYEKHTPVLKRVTLAIEPGEMIGLVGPSGAGKSTTINLIARLYDVDEGQILIDGVDVRRIPIKDLRGQIGVVLQETFLFSGTIHENLTYGQPGADPKDVIAAAMMANAHEFIMERPDGYDSEVEEGGNNFSSGEKQRLAIARAVLRDPRILILDEATSSVDTGTEKKIQEAITRLTKGRTTFAIAHRLSTLAGASRLVVLDKGEVKEVGTHAELAANKGIYHDLVKTQTEMTSVIAVGG